MRRIARLWLVGLVCMLTATVPGQAERFQNPPYIPIQGGYYQVLAADLTGKGSKDLIYWSQPETQPGMRFRAMTGNGNFEVWERLRCQDNALRRLLFTQALTQSATVTLYVKSLF